MLWWNWQGTDVENAASKLVLSVAWARVAHIVGSRGDQAERGGCFRIVICKRAYDSCNEPEFIQVESLGYSFAQAHQNLKSLTFNLHF